MGFMKFSLRVGFFLVGLLAGCGPKEQPKAAFSPKYPELQVSAPLAVARLPMPLQTEFKGWLETQAVRMGFTLDWTEPEKADLVWLTPPQLLESMNISAKGADFAPVPEEWTRARSPLRYEDLIPWIRDHTISWKKVPFALPIAGEGFVLVYRKDILADLRVKDPSLPLGHPSSWTEFQQFAQSLAKHLPALKAGFSPLGFTPEDKERLFLMIHASIANRAIPMNEKTDGAPESTLFGYLYDLQSGAFQPGQNATKEAARVWASLAPLSAIARGVRSDTIPPTPTDCFLRGETALGILPLSVLAKAATVPDLIGKIGIGPIPGSMFHADSSGKLVKTSKPNYRPMLGSAGLLAAVRSESTNAEKAWTFAAVLASPPGEHFALNNQTAGATRNEQVLRLRWDRFNLDGQTTVALREVLREQLLGSTIKNAAPYPRRPDGSERTALLAQLLDQLKGDASVQSFHEDWTRGILAIEAKNQSKNNFLGTPKEIARWAVGLVP